MNQESYEGQNRLESWLKEIERRYHWAHEAGQNQVDFWNEELFCVYLQIFNEDEIQLAKNQKQLFQYLSRRKGEVLKEVIKREFSRALSSYFHKN